MSQKQMFAEDFTGPHESFLGLFWSSVERRGSHTNLWGYLNDFKRRIITSFRRQWVKLQTVPCVNINFPDDWGNIIPVRNLFGYLDFHCHVCCSFVFLGGATVETHTRRKTLYKVFYFLYPIYLRHLCVILFQISLSLSFYFLLFWCAEKLLFFLSHSFALYLLLAIITPKHDYVRSFSLSQKFNVFWKNKYWLCGCGAFVASWWPTLVIISDYYTEISTL